MKIVKILLSIFGVLGLALLALILVCHFIPGTSDKISDFLYHNGSADSVSSHAAGIEKSASDNELTGTAASEEQAANEVPTDGISVVNSENGYQRPEETSMSISEKVAELTGYVPIEGTGQEIKKSEADTLKDSVGYGNTGEGLTFDATMYPYYQMLDDTLKSLYRQIYANANDLTAAFVPVETVSAAQLKNAFTAVVNDHPELFWVDTAYAYKYTGNGTAEMDLKFNSCADDMDASRQLFQANADDILYGARDLGSAYDKEVYVHDQLINKVSYQLSAPMNQSAYSALVSGETVCAGYARAFQYLMQQLSVPCYYCTGYAGQNHAWNIIKLDDGFYNVDATWDDTNPNTYDYFNCSDADYAKDHARRDLSVYLPACNGEQYRRQPGGTGAETILEPEVQKRTLEDAGFLEEQVLKDLKSYYDDCYNQLTAQSGTGFSFQNVINDNALMQEIYAAYKNEGYRSAFMNRYMEEKGIASCSLNVSVEELADGRFLVTHNVQM